MACTLIVAVSCAALVALKFDLYYSPFLILASFLIVALLLIRNAVFVSSVGCALSLFLVVVGPEHVRGPIGILSWFAYRAGFMDVVIEVVAVSILPVTAIIVSGFASATRGRLVLFSVAAVGLLGVWCYWTFNSMFLGWEYLASIPFFACLGWRMALEGISVWSRRPT